MYNNYTCLFYIKAIDSEDNLYVTNARKSNVLKITPVGGMSVFASGSPQQALDDPRGIAIDHRQDTIYVTLPGDGMVVKITQEGLLSEFATLPSPGVPEGPPYKKTI